MYPEHVCLAREVSQRKFDEDIDFAPVRFEYGGSRFIDPTTDAGDGESSGPSLAFCKQLMKPKRDTLYKSIMKVEQHRAVEKQLKYSPFVRGLVNTDK